ncbi:hypothetical protein AGMMS49975_08340 [Clostridia bacterium]|nr:hypothetical protein AGMMS49975_08340 [Clostridia bacterium]
MKINPLLYLNQNDKFIVPVGTINFENVSERIKQAISDNSVITYDGLSELLGLPRRTVSREVKKLQETDKIQRDGAKKNGRWIITS